MIELHVICHYSSFCHHHPQNAQSRPPIATVSSSSSSEIWHPVPKWSPNFVKHQFIMDTHDFKELYSIYSILVRYGRGCSAAYT